MKSRVINTKHLTYEEYGYLGLTSNLKPSLFYGYPVREGEVYLQDKDTNKMSHWVLNEETIHKDENGTLIWIYKPDKKSIAKFPELEGKIFHVVFDQVNTRKWKNQAVKDKWLYGKKPSKKHIEFKKKTHEKRMRRKARMLAKQNAQEKKD